MKTIWKFPLMSNLSEQWITTPRGSQPMSCDVQHHTICIWCLTDSEVKETERWRIWIVGTGHPLPNNPRLSLLNTLIMGEFVWHVFYESKR